MVATPNAYGCVIGISTVDLWRQIRRGATAVRAFKGIDGVQRARTRLLAFAPLPLSKCVLRASSTSSLEDFPALFLRDFSHHGGTLPCYFWMTKDGKCTFSIKACFVGILIICAYIYQVNFAVFCAQSPFEFYFSTMVKCAVIYHKMDWLCLPFALAVQTVSPGFRPQEDGYSRVLLPRRHWFAQGIFYESRIRMSWSPKFFICVHPYAQTLRYTIGMYYRYHMPIFCTWRGLHKRLHLVKCVYSFFLWPWYLGQWITRQPFGARTAARKSDGASVTFGGGQI